MIGQFPQPRTIIQVFGSGWGKKKLRPNQIGRTRCDHAINLACDLLAAGHDVTILVAPGCEVWCRDEMDPTMAMVYARYMRAQLPSNVSFLVNRRNKAVWSTIAEVSWGYEAVCRYIAKQNAAYNLAPDDMTGVTIEYVSCRRHLRRAKAIARYLIGPPKQARSETAVRSHNYSWHYVRPGWRLSHVDQPSPSIGHEAGAYVVLAAHRAGLGKLADALVDAIKLWRWQRAQKGKLDLQKAA